MNLSLHIIKCRLIACVLTTRSSPTLRGIRVRDANSKQRTRRPFHLQSTIAANRAESPVLIDAVPYDNAQEATYSRYKYYQRLRGPTIGNDQALVQTLGLFT
jgi:hypothetical protein